MSVPNAPTAVPEENRRDRFDDATWLLAINPVSGRGRGVKQRSLIEAGLHEQGSRFRTVISTHAGHTADLVSEAVQDGCRRVLIAGGDGSFGEAVNGLFAQNVVAADAVTLALLPVGTGNDWARGHGLPTELGAAIRLATHGRAQPHDAGLIEFAVTGSRRWFINVAGTGFDAAVVERMPSRRLGRLAYVIGLLRGLSAYGPLPLQLAFDGRREKLDALVVFACIGSTCGGGMRVAPEARSDDGLLDLTLIRYLKPLQILRDIRRLFDGTLPSHPKVSCWKTTRVSLDGPAGTPVEADGEPVGHLPVEVSVLPAALRVVLRD